MAKIVYNRCFGGFSLSYAAIMAYSSRKGLTIYALRSQRDETGKLLLGDYEPCPPGEENSILAIYFTDPSGSDESYFDGRAISRTDPDLVAVVEELGAAANGMCAELRVVELPSGTQYRIDEYDGRETVETRESIDWETAP